MTTEMSQLQRQLLGGGGGVTFLPNKNLMMPLQ